MDYVLRLAFRPTVSGADRDAALMRRVGWEYPAGVNVVAEYWPMAADLQVVVIASTDDIAALWELTAEWEDVFDIDVSPAVSANDGLRIGPEVFGRLSRLQS
ncbi:MAG: DUF3303 family protein [Acidimicrobiia bacterium]